MNALSSFVNTSSFVNIVVLMNELGAFVNIIVLMNELGAFVNILVLIHPLNKQHLLFIYTHRDLNSNKT